VLSDGQGHLAMGVYVEATTSLCGPISAADAWIVSLDLATGATRWMNGWPQAGSNDISGGFDESGNLYLVARSGMQFATSSYAPNGTLRWQNLSSSSTLVFGGVSSGRLLVLDEGTALHLLDAATGSELDMIPNLAAEFPGVLTSIAGAVLFFDSSGPLQLLAFDPAGGTPLRQPLMNAGGSGLVGNGPPLLTSRGTLTFAAYQVGVNDSLLEEVGLDGVTRFECQLPNGSWDYYAAASVGHWVDQVDPRTLVSISVPDLQPALTGWTTSRGAMTQEGHPR
jgi:hypothetical protein